MTTHALAIEVIASDADLAAIEPAWARVWEECVASGADDATPTPFQSPAWLRPWWRAFGEGSLCLIVCREGRDVVGCAPLQIVQREVRLVGTGNTDYLDTMARPGYAQACADAMLQVLADRSDWDDCDFRCLRPASALLRVTAPFAADERLHEEPCPAIDPRATLPPAMARRVAYGRRRASREGGLRIERAGVDATVPASLERLFALHAARWRARGEAGVLADTRTRGFHREAAERLAEAGLLQLLTVWVGDRPIASYYGLIDARRAYYYLGGFDPDAAAFNPGALAIAAAIDQAAEDGVQAFDFLAGREPYKYEWGAVDQPRHRRHLRRLSRAARGTRATQPRPSIVYRTAVRADLRQLEWDAHLRRQRQIIEDTYAATERGEQVMLIAAHEERPIGQVWIDLTRHRAEHVALIWALRVHPDFRGHGIGRGLLHQAQQIIRQHEVPCAQIDVESENTRAREMYARAGFRPDHTFVLDWSYRDPDGVEVHHRQELLAMRKRLQP